MLQADKTRAEEVNSNEVSNCLQTTGYYWLWHPVIGD